MCSLIGIILGKWSETGLEPLQLHGVYIVLWLITEVFLPLRQRAAAGENSPRLEHSNKVIKEQEHTVLILYGFTVMNHYSISDMLFPLETYNCFKYGRNKSQKPYLILSETIVNFNFKMNSHGWKSVFDFSVSIYLFSTKELH